MRERILPSFASALFGIRNNEGRFLQLLSYLFQDLCHLHSDRSLVQQKTVTIINCFIDSTIPPSLQIDITQECADKILERKLEATPYLFREAQVLRNYV